MKTKLKVGSGGSVGSLRYDLAQDLDGAQQNQAQANIGLGNVDNTADSTKPVSALQAAAIAAATAGLATSASIPQAVRDTPLTGLSLANPADITAADTVVTAMGKLQAQLDLPTGAGAWSLLAQTAITGPVSIVDMFDVFTSAYDEYYAQVFGVNCSMAGGLQLQFQTAAGIQTGPDFTASMAADAAATSGTAGTVNVASTGQAVLAGSEGTLMTIRLWNMNSASARKALMFEGVHLNAASNWQRISKVVANLRPGPIKGLRFSWSAGTFLAGGTIRIFGIKNS